MSDHKHTPAITTKEQLALRKLQSYGQGVPEHHINREAVRSLREKGLAYCVQFGTGQRYWVPTRAAVAKSEGQGQ